MSEERAVKLKLKRRKGSAAQEPQASESSHLPPAASTVRKIPGNSWLSEIDLTATEQTWKQVLNATFTDVQSVGWDAVPGLPAFNRKITDTRPNGTAEPEVFKAGEQRFEWFPFPTGSPQHITEHRDSMQESSAEGTITAEEQERLLGTTDRGIVPAAEDRNNQLKEGTVPNVLLVQAKHRPNNRAEQKLQTGNMYSPPKPTVDERSHLAQAPEAAEKRDQENMQTHDSLRHDLCSPIAPRESANTSSANTGALENCPMCLKPFSMRLSQLDIDSHLAQCLSETAVDVMW
ncbi:hypothetical protein XENTR_v10018904 [Xenopus tropicalis]|uniref:FA core complex associated protein 20 n=1 Tax=Xenopus tropicalis TaxID=8364 RepID=A0A6I8SKT5_XENTR|nr:Fanconi anemia core complex-associated protein 20 [Xenopus tropicalis]XP_004916210.1 Fanconi anemia core complex-associated protein 20 [Xenopus tropicalis]KAE8592864.1 hypothetical protein XENTR_v10018904 [Xenopus tropicalis]KAE8592865.1 hypothetical protein XENTR_v10018904 [Xenopus tropicalis]|eukprot:XP_004916209.2 PREDICTED: Fanconi anemia core complex-associated protein 20 [Xenopus tropicalis]